MPVYARASTLKQQVRSGMARPAESEIALDVFKQLLSFFSVSGTVVPAVGEHPQGRDAFDAVRHECAATTPNLIVAGPEDSFVPLRPVTERGESFRGKHGKLSVIRIVR
jgi:hypothetical protein